MRKLLIIAAAALMTFSAQAQRGSNNTSREQAYKMTRVLDLISNLYVDTVNQQKLVETGIVAMLKELDPHSVYITQDDVKAMNEPLEGNFEGIGIQFNIMNDTLMIVAVIPGGPSERVGLMAGDRIIYVDTANIAGVGLTNQMVQKKLRGKKGTVVTVKVKRHRSKDLIDFKITRDKIPIYSVDAAYMVDAKAGIGYIKINKFAATTTSEYNSAISKLRKQGLKHLIVDLTDNGGGYLNTGFDLASQFLQSGKMVVFTQGSKMPRQNYYTESGHNEKDYGRVVVMVNENSASASEIVSGALQDWDRAVLVGRRTFGKGLVQNQFPLPDGSMMRLTVARYYTPTGRCIQRSYEGGVDEYNKEFDKRYNDGELYSADSIHLPMGEKYFTKVNNRVVYGGGGIMPDVFVPIDTTYSSRYYVRMVRQGIFNKFVLNYIDNNRAELEKKYKSTKTDKDFKTFDENFTVTDDFLKQLTDFAEKEKLPFDEKGFERGKEHMRVNLKAAIARDLYDSGEYYQIINRIDPIFKEAVRVMKDEKLYKSKLQPSK